MKLANGSFIDTSIPMDVTFESLPLYLGNIVNFSIQLVFSGTPVGTLKLQCSSDLGNILNPGLIQQSDKVVNWTDVNHSDQAISSDGTHTWNVQNVGYNWVRIVYTAVSGTGSLDIARFNIKGV